MAPAAEPGAIEALPWRGSEAERPALAIPPQPMPLRLGGCWRKRWRYIGAYDERFMLCAARVEVGPARQAFWALWDRERRVLRERTRPVLGPLLRSEVRFDGDRLTVASRDLRIHLDWREQAGERGEDRFGAVECACASGEGGYTWTRKLAGIPARGRVATRDGEHAFDGRAVDDRSAGYHRHYTSWRWSAGVGEAADGRALAWNLVAGINDPPARSERAVWVGGEPGEPGPVSFDGLESIRFEDGSTMTFAAEASRARRERLPGVMRSDYEAPFGSFAGSLAGIELAGGLGVMERHDAVW